VSYLPHFVSDVDDLVLKLADDELRDVFALLTAVGRREQQIARELAHDLRPHDTSQRDDINNRQIT
jgi:hypothetical protein